MTTIPPETLLDVLYRMQIISYLYSGLIFALSLHSFDVVSFSSAHSQAFHTATKLLFFLTLFTEQGKRAYVNSIIKGNGLNAIAFALSIGEDQVTQPSRHGPSALTEYKVPVDWSVEP